MQCSATPASLSHSYGWEAEDAVKTARQHVANLLGADPREIVWTSGATEGNNLAIKGAARFYAGRGKHIMTLKTEHKAMLDTCRELERQGDVTYLDVRGAAWWTSSSFALQSGRTRSSRPC